MLLGHIHCLPISQIIAVISDKGTWKTIDDNQHVCFHLQDSEINC